MSLTEQVRRTQIMEATIKTLAEYGYLGTSFVRIGKQAGITPSLIPYHFKDKESLTRATLSSIQTARAEHVIAVVATASTYTTKLTSAITADITNMSNNLELFQASAEIIFGARTSRGLLTYLGDQDSQIFQVIRTILEDGVKTDEFRTIDPYNTAIFITGSIDTFLAQLGMRPHFNAAEFNESLLDSVNRIVKKEKI